MKILSQAIFLVMFAVLSLISCSSGSLTDEQAIQLFRANNGYPRAGFIFVEARSADRTQFQELNRLVEANFLTKNSNGHFAPSEKRKAFFKSFYWNPSYKQTEAVKIYSHAMDVTAVRDRRNVDGNTVEMVFELKLHETPEFIEFRKIAPSIVREWSNNMVGFMAIGIIFDQYPVDEVVLEKVVFEKWEKGWRVANRRR